MPDRESHFSSDRARLNSDPARDTGLARGYYLITLGGLALLGQDGQEITSLGPRNLALLTYLALATKPLSRDHVSELFWGDRDEDRARHSMRGALSKLRQLFGPDSIPRRSDRILLEPSVLLTVDARALAAASSAGDTRKVVELYTGPFLDGVHAGDARSFEDWSDAERSMYESRFTGACLPECARLREAGDWMGCAELARRWLKAAPLDPKAALELLRSLAAPVSGIARIDASFGTFGTFVSPAGPTVGDARHRHGWHSRRLGCVCRACCATVVASLAHGGQRHVGDRTVRRGRGCAGDVAHERSAATTRCIAVARACGGCAGGRTHTRRASR